MATQTLTVKVADFDGENKFEINFSKQKTISAAPGDIIVFDQSDSSNTGHPLRIALYPDGEHKIDAYQDALDYVAYINLNVDLLNYYNAANPWNYGDGNVAANSRPKAEFGESHWVAFGQNESSRTAPPVMGRYEAGVSTSGTPGSSGAQTTLTVTNPDLHGTYFYYCQNHAGMGGMIHYGDDPEKYQIIDQGATAHDAEEGDVTSDIRKVVERYDSVNGWTTIGVIDSPHINPWSVVGTNTSILNQYKISYSVRDQNNTGLYSATRLKVINIGTAPVFARPAWMDPDIPIDEDGRIWAIQVIYAGRADNTRIEPWTQQAGITTTLSSGMQTFYVPLRNDSIAGAGASEALHSVSNPISGWDVGIPQTYSFLSYFTSANTGGNPGIRAMLIPPGWEFAIYTNPGYSSLRYSYSSSIFFHQPDSWGSIGDILRNYDSVYINNVTPVAVSSGTNAAGSMVYWLKNGGLYNSGLGGYSYLFKMTNMP